MVLHAGHRQPAGTWPRGASESRGICLPWRGQATAAHARWRGPQKVQWEHAWAQPRNSPQKCCRMIRGHPGPRTDSLCPTLSVKHPAPTLQEPSEQGESGRGLYPGPPAPAEAPESDRGWGGRFLRAETPREMPEAAADAAQGTARGGDHAWQVGVEESTRQ